jgi:threonyl-tRNA synthetase
MQKLPYQVIVGDKEVAANMIAVRTRGGGDLGQMGLDAFLARLRSELPAGSA